MNLERDRGSPGRKGTTKMSPSPHPLRLETIKIWVANQDALPKFRLPERKRGSWKGNHLTHENPFMVTGGGIFLSALIRSHLDTTHLAACVNPEGKKMYVFWLKKKKEQYSFRAQADCLWDTPLMMNPRCPYTQGSDSIDWGPPAQWEYGEAQGSLGRRHNSVLVVFLSEAELCSNLYHYSCQGGRNFPCYHL